MHPVGGKQGKNDQEDVNQEQRVGRGLVKTYVERTQRSEKQL